MIEMILWLLGCLVVTLFLLLPGLLGLVDGRLTRAQRAVAEALRLTGERRGTGTTHLHGALEGFGVEVEWTTWPEARPAVAVVLVDAPGCHRGLRRELRRPRPDDLIATARELVRVARQQVAAHPQSARLYAAQVQEALDPAVRRSALGVLLSRFHGSPACTRALSAALSDVAPEVAVLAGQAAGARGARVLWRLARRRDVTPRVRIQALDHLGTLPAYRQQVTSAWRKLAASVDTELAEAAGRRLRRATAHAEGGVSLVGCADAGGLSLEGG